MLDDEAVLGELAELRATGVRVGLSRQRHEPARDGRARARARRLRRRPGHLEPARALGRAGARRRRGRGPDGLRQGGARQRAPGRRARAAGAGRARARARDDARRRRARGRARPAVGRRGAERRLDGGDAAQQPGGRRAGRAGRSPPRRVARGGRRLLAPGARSSPGTSPAPASVSPVPRPGTRTGWNHVPRCLQSFRRGPCAALPPASCRSCWGCTSSPTWTG